GDLDRGELMTVITDHPGHKPRPRLDVARAVTVAKHQVVRWSRRLCEPFDLSEGHLVPPPPQPVHVHPRHQRPAVAAELAQRAGDDRVVIPPPRGHPARRPGYPQRKDTELQRRRHASEFRCYPVSSTKSARSGVRSRASIASSCAAHRSQYGANVSPSRSSALFFRTASGASSHTRRLT